MHQRVHDARALRLFDRVPSRRGGSFLRIARSYFLLASSSCFRGVEGASMVVAAFHALLAQTVGCIQERLGGKLDSSCEIS